MTRLLILFAVTVAITLYTGVLWAASNSTSTSDDLKSLLEYDFTQDIDGQVLVDRRHSCKAVDDLLGVKAMAAVSKHPKDEIILGKKLLAGDKWWSNLTTTIFITQYTSRNGQLPECGPDLFPELEETGAFSNFTGLIPTHRMIKYGAGINLATNRFYQTFSDPEWHPGGIYLELLEPQGNGTFLHGDRPVHFGNAQYPENPGKAYYIKFFSAAEDHVLYDDYITFDISCED